MPGLGAAYVTIRGDLAGLKSDLNKALLQIKGLEGSVDKATSNISRSFSSATMAVKGFISAIAIQKITQLSESLFDAGASSSRLSKAYVEIAGSSASANKEFEFLRKTSDTLGQNFYVLAEAYKGITASAKGTALQGQSTRDIFVAITKAASSLGLSAEGTNRSLLAIQQMMSKGKVSAEELRQQLGENLPGAFGLMAKAVGVSTAKLDEMLKEGKVLASDVLPKFARVLSEQYPGAIDDATRASNKFAEAWMDLKVEMAKSGFLDSATQAIKNMTEALKDPEVQRSLKDLSTNLGAVILKLSELAKFAGLRSVFGTMGQASELASKGLLDLNEFSKKGFMERQRTVDDILAKQKEMNGSLSDSEMEKILVASKEKTNDLETATISATDAIKDFTTEEKRREAAIKDYIKTLEQEIAMIGLDSAAKERLEAREKGITGARLASVDAMISQKHAQEALWKAAEESNDAMSDNIEDGIRMAQEGNRRRAEDKKKAEQKITDDYKAALKKREEDEKHYLERVQDATADTFYDIFKNTEDGFSGMFDRIGDYFLRMLAEMAAQAIAKPIIVPILQSMSGSLGMTSAAAGAGGASSTSGLLQMAGNNLWNNYGANTSLGGYISGAMSTPIYTSGLGWGNAASEMTSAYADASYIGQSSIGATTTVGSLLSAYGMGSLGYQYIGGAVGLPQGEYS